MKCKSFILPDSMADHFDWFKCGGGQKQSKTIKLRLYIDRKDDDLKKHEKMTKVT